MPVIKPTPGVDADTWGVTLNAALDALDTSVTTAVTTAQSASTLAGTVNTALGTKADTSTVYTKTAADTRFVRTINSTTPDVNGNVTVSPVPGVRTIVWDGVSTHPLRATASSDLTQPVIWVSPVAHPPTIGTGYAVENDIWFKT